MFRHIRDYPLLDLQGLWRPRAYGDPQADGTWDGWLVFFPLDGGLAVAPPAPATTQRTLETLATWADGLTPVYLEGSLIRALETAEQPPLLTRLAEAERVALEDAEQLETAAEVDRRTGELAEDAARAARADVEALRQERLAAEGELAATEEAAARLEAKVHDAAARDARSIAVDAARRRRSASAEATARKRAPRHKPRPKR